MDHAQLAKTIHHFVTQDDLQVSNRGVFSLGGRIIDAIRDYIAKMATASVAQEVKEFLKSAAIKFYDEYNIASIPDDREKQLKSFFRPLFIQALDSTFGLKML